MSVNVSCCISIFTSSLLPLLYHRLLLCGSPDLIRGSLGHWIEERGVSAVITYPVAGVVYFALALGFVGTIMIESALCFPLGILAAKYRSRFDAAIKKWWIAGATFLVFTVCLIIGARGIIPCKMVASCSFVILVLYAILVIPIKNAATVQLSKVYLELYVIQGMILEIVRPLVSNDWIYMVIAACGSIVAA